VRKSLGSVTAWAAMTSGERSDELADLIKLEAILAERVAQSSDGDTPGPVLDILDAGRPTDYTLDHQRSDPKVAIPAIASHPSLRGAEPELPLRLDLTCSRRRRGYLR
jgi:hypothetical protein